MEGESCPPLPVSVSGSPTTNRHSCCGGGVLEDGGFVVFISCDVGVVVELVVLADDDGSGTSKGAV